MNKRQFQLLLTAILVAGLIFVYMLGGISFPFENAHIPSYEGDAGEVLLTEVFQTEKGGYGISASHPLAVKIGTEILDKGGNAVDASVAVSFALSVLEPHSSGIGGGGAMLVHIAGEAPVYYDYRERMPQSGGTSNMNIGVPGFVKGMETVHQNHGQLDFSTVLEPAVRLAAEGFEVHEHLVKRLQYSQPRIQGEDMAHFFPDRASLQTGHTLQQTELAQTLELIQKEGAEAFYAGEIGKSLTNHLPHMNMEDLQSYTVQQEEPVHGTYLGYDVYAGGPPTGGITLIQILTMAEELDLSGREGLDSHARGSGDAYVPDGDDAYDTDMAEYMALLGELINITYQDRISTVADPAFESIPVKKLTSVDYARELLENIEQHPALEQYTINDSPADREDHSNTTHFVVYDDEGTMVSGTNTLSQVFGSGVYLDGYFLNNQLSNFSESGQSLNLPQPGKTPRSFITPTILAKDEQPVLGIGSPGGKRIPAILSQVIIDFIRNEQSLQTSIDNPRFYAEQDQLFIEENISPDTLGKLKKYGFHVQTEHMHSELFFGGVQAIYVDQEEGKVHGGADRRRGGSKHVHSEEDGN